MCREQQNVVVPRGEVTVIGYVCDGAGDPVPDALVEWWQRDDAGTLWGRCATDSDGRFEFVTDSPRDGYADVIVFARGLLKHLVTRCYFTDGDDVLDALDEADRGTLLARREGDAFRFDINLQGDGQTVFFAV
jgi:protocatechuate 3,4-dioxygenase, alpha subunit